VRTFHHHHLSCENVVVARNVLLNYYCCCFFGLFGSKAEQEEKNAAPCCCWCASQMSICYTYCRLLWWEFLWIKTSLRQKLPSSSLEESVPLGSVQITRTLLGQICSFPWSHDSASSSSDSLEKTKSLFNTLVEHTLFFTLLATAAEATTAGGILGKVLNCS